MALPPLPPETTPRLVIKYTANGEQRTAIARLPLGGNSAAAATMYGIIASGMSQSMWTGDSVTGADFIDQGTNVSNPLAVSPVTGVVNITPDGDQEPNFFSFTGRSSDGRKTKFGMYAPLTNLNQTGFRDATPPAPEAALLSALQSAGARTISGGTPVWHTYVNYGSNAYHQRKKR